MKALVSEIVSKFQKRLSYLGLKVRELTGDMQLTRKEIAETQMIVTTPEKWDVVTRKPMGDGDLALSVRLLIIDEVHLLHEERCFHRIFSRMYEHHHRMTALYKFQYFFICHTVQIRSRLRRAVLASHTNKVLLQRNGPERRAEVEEATVPIYTQEISHVHKVRQCGRQANNSYHGL